MAKKKTETSNSFDQKIIDTFGQAWFDGNADKNDGAKRERKASEKLELEMANALKPAVTELKNGTFLEIGFVDGEVEEIDPRKFLENHPDLFWDLVTISKTAVVTTLGEKEAAKNSRIVHTHKFKIAKHKTDPRG